MSTPILVRNPRTGQHDYQFVAPSRNALGTVCAGLRGGQPRWAGIGLAARIEVMRDFIAALDRNRGAIISALTADTGRHALSVMELDALLGIMDERCQFAPAVTAGLGGVSRRDESLRFEQQYVPYELVGIISPWNYPLILSFLDAVPALLMGCAVLIKPSEITPRFIDPLRGALEDVPPLKAVLEIVPGPGDVGQAIIDLTDTAVFTGSVATGRKVLRQAAEQFKPVFLELGGKDPALVLEGADPRHAAEVVLRGATENAGQLCSSIERVYAHRSLVDAFTYEVCRLASELTFNHPNVDAGDLGPVIFAQQANILRDHLSDALDKGARILVGGNVVEIDGGLWCEPTVVVNVNHEMKLMRDETFGPIIPIMSFATIDQAVRLANDSTYGLSATVIGPQSEAMAVGRRLKAGGVWINDFDTIGGVGEKAEKQAFNYSGLGGSRYGPGGFIRFVRKQALVVRATS